MEPFRGVLAQAAQDVIDFGNPARLPDGRPKQRPNAIFLAFSPPRPHVQGADVTNLDPLFSFIGHSLSILH